MIVKYRPKSISKVFGRYLEKKDIRNEGNRNCSRTKPFTKKQKNPKFELKVHQNMIKSKKFESNM